MQKKRFSYFELNTALNKKSKAMRKMRIACCYPFYSKTKSTKLFCELFELDKCNLVYYTA